MQGASTRKICLLWGSSQDSTDRHLEGKARPRQPWMDGLAPVGQQVIRENSAQSAESRNQRKMVSGPVPAGLGTKENSVQSAESQSQQGFPNISAINVAGNRKIRRNRRSSVRNAEIHLITEISSGRTLYRDINTLRGCFCLIL